MKWERIVEVSGEQRGSLREITYSTQETEDAPRQSMPQGNTQPPRAARRVAVRWVEVNVSVAGAVRTVYLEEEDAVQAVALGANFLQRQEQPDREARAECCTGAAREIGCVEFDEGLVRDVCVWWQRALAGQKALCCHVVILNRDGFPLRARSAVVGHSCKQMPCRGVCLWCGWLMARSCALPCLHL